MNKELGLRIITGLTGVAVIVSGMVYTYYAVWLVCAVIALFGLREILSIMGISQRRYKWTSLTFGIAIWGIFLFDLIMFDLGLGELPADAAINLSILLFPILAIISLFNAKEKQPYETLSIIILGFIYCFLPLILLYKISIPELPSDYNFSLPLGILFLTWFLDSFAYFGGRLFGKHHLFKRISPKKTWEGAFCGIVFCMGLGIGLHMYTEAANYNWIIIAGIISVFSQLGDLVESMFKRSRQIKDSSQLLPGHGGMLDRFDGIYLSVPFIYLYFSFL
ncbi:MAG: phosphatidate cytidylyltransferase [Bacteroidota bacterium]